MFGFERDSCLWPPFPSCDLFPTFPSPNPAGWGMKKLIAVHLPVGPQFPSSWYALAVTLEKSLRPLASASFSVKRGEPLRGGITTGVLVCTFTVVALQMFKTNRKLWGYPGLPSRVLYYSREKAHPLGHGKKILDALYLLSHPFKILLYLLYYI